jgi:hypothetical protein
MAHIQFLEMADSFARYPGREGEVEEAWKSLLETRLTVTAVKKAFVKCLPRGSGVANLRVPGHVAWLVGEARRLDRQTIRNTVSTGGRVNVGAWRTAG